MLIIKFLFPEQRPTSFMNNLLYMDLAVFRVTVFRNARVTTLPARIAGANRKLMRVCSARYHMANIATWANITDWGPWWRLTASGPRLQMTGA